ncbi:hypothetical protein D3C78_1599900 [compost metagenome]
MDLDQAEHLLGGQFGLDLGGDDRILDIFHCRRFRGRRGIGTIGGLGGMTNYRQQQQTGYEQRGTEFVVHDGSFLEG